MNTPTNYLNAVRNLLTHLEQTQLPAIERAADLIIAALAHKGSIYCGEIGHGIQGDFINRAGGLAAVKALKDSSTLKPNDVLVIGSVSGRNGAPIDIALAARQRGAKTIGLTSRAYTQQVTALHPSGKKLCDVVDVVIDNGAPYGDAAVDVPGLENKVLPVSGVGCAVIGHLLWGRVMEKMAAAGNPPTVFMSINREGGQEFYKTALAQFEQRGY